MSDTPDPTVDPIADPSADPIAAHVAEHGDDLFAVLNNEFADAVALIARTLGERPDATAAEVTGLDGAGLDVRIRTDEGHDVVRIAFGEVVTDPAEITTRLFELHAAARAAAGEDEPAQAAPDLSAFKTFLTTVSATRTIHEHLVEVTFAGGDLHELEPVGPDTFLYVLLPPPGRTELTIDRDFRWEEVPNMAEEDRPVGAYYTLRRWRPEVAELDVLMVLHPDPGPAGAWAERVQVGDPVALWGPRTAWDPPANTDRYVLVADETGLPAAAVILETLDPDVPVQVIAEVADASARQELPERPSVQVTWLHRDGAHAGTTTLLADAVAALDRPGGTPYVWGGGESKAMTACRRHVRDTWGLEQAQVSLLAYWRHTAG